MRTQILKSVMLRAWQIKRQYDVIYNGQTLFSECLKMAWSEIYRTDKATELMRAGVVCFWFQKVDGTLRKAYGTLCNNLIPTEKQPTGNGNRRQSESTQAFFDLEKLEWRCFKKANLIKIEQI